MDLPDTLAAAAKQHGVRFVLSTDSHQPNNLPFMKYAVDLARRAWLEAGGNLNTRPVAGVSEGPKRAREKRQATTAGSPARSPSGGGGGGRRPRGPPRGPAG